MISSARPRGSSITAPYYHLPIRARSRAEYGGFTVVFNQRDEQSVAEQIAQIKGTYLSA